MKETLGTLLSSSYCRTELIKIPGGCLTVVSLYPIKKWVTWITRNLQNMSLAKVKNKINKASLS